MKIKKQKLLAALISFTTLFSVFLYSVSTNDVFKLVTDKKTLTDNALAHEPHNHVDKVHKPFAKNVGGDLAADAKSLRKQRQPRKELQNFFKRSQFGLLNSLLLLGLFKS